MMCKHDDGCNVPEGECSGAYMTKQTSGETLEEIAERWMKSGTPAENAGDALRIILSDPAILDHIPAVKALREENERLKSLASRLDGQLGKRPCQNNRCVEFNRMESQLAELRQGGEAVAYAVTERSNIQLIHDYDEFHLEFFRTSADAQQYINDEVLGLLEAGMGGEDVDLVALPLYTRPQPAIPPGYALDDASIRDGEAVGEVVLESMGVGDAKVVRFHMYKKIPPVGTKLYTQPAIPPGYVVPDEVRSALECFENLAAHLGGCSNHGCVINPPAPGMMGTNGQCQCYRNGTKAQRMLYAGRNLAKKVRSMLASAPAIQPQAVAPSVPVAEKDSGLEASCSEFRDCILHEVGPLEINYVLNIFDATVGEHLFVAAPADGKEGE